MLCDFEKFRVSSGKTLFVCKICKRSVVRNAENYFGKCKNTDPVIAIPTDGPGTELEKLFLEIGAEKNGSHQCSSCEEWRDQMNLWGVEGCLQNIQLIIERVRKQYHNTTLLNRLRAASGAFTSGVAFRIDLLNPIPSLVREAIRRAGK